MFPRIRHEGRLRQVGRHVGETEDDIGRAAVAVRSPQLGQRCAEIDEPRCALCRAQGEDLDVGTGQTAELVFLEWTMDKLNGWKRILPMAAASVDLAGNRPLRARVCRKHAPERKMA
jgi:hypothetical protein